MIEYSLVGEGEAARFFYLDRESGEISLRESILNVESTIYRVSPKSSCRKN